MAQQEICQIVEKERQTFSKNFWWWEAHQITPQGAYMIAKSGEFTHPSQEEGCLGTLVETFTPGLQDRNINIYNERRRAANSQIIAILLAKGWEVAAVNSEGLTTMLRREMEYEAPIEQVEHIDHTKAASSQVLVSVQQQKKSNTGCIIGIAAVMILCGCIIVFGILWQYGDPIIQNLGF